MITKSLKKELIKMQKGEITGYLVYQYLANKSKNPNNKTVLTQLSLEEKGHYDLLKQLTEEDCAPNNLKLLFFKLISRFLGLTFGIKLLENQEDTDQTLYKKLEQDLPDITKIIEDEENHERILINLLDEERLAYMSSVVLGLNDALVELTGALAGFTLSLQNSRTIALIGLITGISASLSMAASEYLSTKADESNNNSEGKNALKASIYTGIAYVFTVIFLIVPFLILSNYVVALLISIGIAILIILFFNYYISVAKDYNFKKRFFSMASISLGVAALSFGIGYLVNTFIGV
jgi:VIT1/CCC1 family predicted Fe2+/Mn2+ transporter